MEKDTAGQVLEVIFEDGVLKPIGAIRVLNEHERATVYLYPKVPSKNIAALHGTLSKEDADQMEKIIEQEFERIEGEW